MKKSVKVATHPVTGSVITKNENKPEFGTIRVDQEFVSMEKGFVNISKRSAFLAGKYEGLQALGLSEGETLPGQIIRKESFTPMFEGQSAKINPSTNEKVLINGKETYFQDEYTEDASAKDVLLKSTSVNTAVSASKAEANEHSVN